MAERKRVSVFYTPKKILEELRRIYETEHKPHNTIPTQLDFPAGLLTAATREYRSFNNAKKKAGIPCNEQSGGMSRNSLREDIYDYIRKSKLSPLTLDVVRTRYSRHTTGSIKYNLKLLEKGGCIKLMPQKEGRYMKYIIEVVRI